MISKKRGSLGVKAIWNLFAILVHNAISCWFVDLMLSAFSGFNLVVSSLHSKTGRSGWRARALTLSHFSLPSSVSFSINAFQGCITNKLPLVFLDTVGTAIPILQPREHAALPLTSFAAEITYIIQLTYCQARSRTFQ